MLPDSRTCVPILGPGQKSNIVGQTFEIFHYRQCLTVWPRRKYCLPGRITSVMFLKNFKNFLCLYSSIKRNMLDEQCFVMWPNSQTLCFTSKSQMFDKQCLIVSPGTNFCPSTCFLLLSNYRVNFLYQFLFFSGNFFQLGESSIMDLGLNYDGTILYSAVGNAVKMVDLKT